MDNMLFGVFFYEENSTSPELDGITMRLHKAEMKGDLIFHVIYVAVTCIKELGIDGLYRGEFLEGVMAGKYP